MRRLLMRRTARATTATTATTPPSGDLWSTVYGSVATDTAVTVPVGQTITYDMASQSPGALDIFGTLQFQPTTRSLLPNYIRVGNGGALLIGTEANPWPRNQTATIELRGAVINKSTRIVINTPAATATGGRLTELWPMSGAVDGEVWTVTVNGGNTTMSVSSSVSGALGTATVGSYFTAGSRCRFKPLGTFSAGQVITFSGVAKAFKADILSRGLIVEPGGRVEMIAAHTAFPYARADEHIANGSNQITLHTIVDWLPGEKLLVGPTYYYGTASGTPQEVTIQSITTVSGRSVVTTVENISGARWGRMQYVTDAGMALAAGTLTMPSAATAGTWNAAAKTVDQRALIMHLTRPIKIQGANDAAYTNDGLGGHVMWMGNTSIVKFDGVEQIRMGQAGIIGAYGFHAHLCSLNTPNGTSLPSDGTITGSVAGNQYVKNCTSRDAQNRFMVIHGTHGLLVEKNIGWKSKGHMYFMEDGAEELNTLVGNVAVGADEPTAGNALLNHDRGSTLSGAQSGGAGFWLANMNNTFEDNIALGNKGCGFWNVPARRMFGPSREVPGFPFRKPILSHARNYSGFNNGVGMITSQFPNNEIGTQTAIAQYWPTDDSTDTQDENKLVRVTIDAYQGHMNDGGGYLNHVADVLYQNWTIVGNAGRGITGKTTGLQKHISQLRGLLVSAKSLNDNGDYSTLHPNNPRAGLASYHGTVQADHMLFMYYKPGLDPTTYFYGYHAEAISSVVGCDDHYEGPGEEEQFVRFPRDKCFFYDAQTAISRPPQTDGNAVTNGSTWRYYTFNQTLPDPTGFATARVGSTIVLNRPIFVSGLADLQAIPGTPLADGQYVSTMARMGGLGKIRTTEDDAASTVMPAPTLGITWTRLNPADDTVIGTFAVGDGDVSLKLGNMRTLAVNPINSKYAIEWDGGVMANSDLRFELSRCDQTGDLVVLRFPRSAAVTSATMTKNYNTTPPSGGDIAAGYGKVLSSAASYAAMLALADGGYWHDTANNHLYVAHRGNRLTSVPWVAQGYPADSNNVLWNLVRYRIA